jgi:glucokinase
LIAQFKKMTAEICSKAEHQALGGARICAPGPLDTETGTVLHIPTLPGWEEFPLRHELGRELGLPVVAEDDGIAAVYGEWKFGAGRGSRNLVFVTISTGVGGGVPPDGPLCSCGATACFDAFAAGTALANGRARRAAPNKDPCGG